MYDKCYSNQTLNMKSCFLDRLESPRPLWRPAGNGQRLETVWWRHWVAQVKTRRQQLPEKWPIPVEFPESKSITCFNVQPGYLSISALTSLEDFIEVQYQVGEFGAITVYPLIFAMIKFSNRNYILYCFFIRKFYIAKMTDAN